MSQRTALLWGLIPKGVVEFFSIYLILLAALQAVLEGRAGIILEPLKTGSIVSCRLPINVVTH
jgi:hypothetical protein